MVRLSSAPVASPHASVIFPLAHFYPRAPKNQCVLPISQSPSARRKPTRPPHHYPPPHLAPGATATPHHPSPSSDPSPLPQAAAPRPPPKPPQCCAPTCRPSSPDATVHRLTNLPPTPPPVVVAPLIRVVDDAFHSSTSPAPWVAAARGISRV
jgi:hypothetical protein